MTERNTTELFLPNQIIRKLLRTALSEIGATIAMGVAALGALVFMLIADEAVEGDTHEFDQSILLALREPGDLDNPVGPYWVEMAFADITALGGYTVLTLLVVAVAGYLVAAGKRGSALLVVGAVASGTLLSNLLKMGFDRPRPDLVAHLAHAQSSSFPSGHAMLSAVTYLTLGVLLARVHEKRRTKIIVMTYAIVLTLLIGVSRVYLGVHWPTDVLAGWALGAAWAALWWLLAWWLQRRGKIEPPGESAA
jgi:undecaprenyl-diphosphatase